ncbi:MAG TPA: hypothetical protein VN455_11420 [Methanotrichaceae archaeon]|nr:hypothetical protein [Methanotrichaceae archaeon]
MAGERRNTNAEGTNLRAGEKNKGTMTVQEAGRRGGERTAQTHGREFYEEIGHKGGQRVRELIEQGKRAQGLGPESRGREPRT